MFTLDPSYIGKVWPTFMWTIMIVAALGCCMGFKSFVWFMSVGYGFAVMCIGIFHLVFGLFNHSLTLATGILSVLLVIYGYRLGGYILKRELTNDGVHLKATEYEIWVAFLRSHAIMEETVYHSSEG